MRPDQITGNAPVDPALRETMSELAHLVHFLFNGREIAENITPSTGFVLMVFPFGAGGKCHITTNAQRRDVIGLLREQVAHMEGRVQPEAGHA